MVDLGLGLEGFQGWDEENAMGEKSGRKKIKIFLDF